MAISFFFQFGAYQACACSEREFNLTDVFEAAATMVQKLVVTPHDVDLRDQILLFFNTENTVEGFKPVYTAEDISQGCVIQILLSDNVEVNQPLAVDVHLFHVHSFRSPHFCDYCGQVLFGLVRQGLKCAGCGQNFHKRCAYKIPNNCSRQRFSQTLYTSYDVSKSQMAKTGASHHGTVDGSGSTVIESGRGARSVNVPFEHTKENTSEQHTNAGWHDNRGTLPDSKATEDNDVNEEIHSVISTLQNKPTSAEGERCYSSSESQPIRVGQIRPISASSVRAGGLLYGRPLWTQQVHNIPVEVPHTFELHRSAKPTVCQHCRKLLHGLFRQDCKLWVHKKCASLVPNNCEGEQFLMDDMGQNKDGSLRTAGLQDHSGTGKLRKKLFVRGQTVGSISAAETSHGSFSQSRVFGRLVRQLTQEEATDQSETKIQSLPSKDLILQYEPHTELDKLACVKPIQPQDVVDSPANLPVHGCPQVRGLDELSRPVIPLSADRRKASFRLLHQMRNVNSSIGAGSSRVTTKSDDTPPFSVESVDGLPETKVLEREQSIERSLPKIRPGTRLQFWPTNSNIERRLM
ncbi:Serine/threonine-protein kinase D1 [Fasciola gigantica]|uniref:Serine/threonine-protein kinase D1 n=1 Tax=Fasciola gigantica TaxID=46835 RepID=A0A504YG11_FASGI|nr:Serine/threonine-protein kinase D1 [Fasciola gigantica]